MDQLTEDAVDARKKGMSYGKYMAMKHQERKPQKEAAGEPVKKTVYCAICGAVIQNAVRNQKYCTGECADIAMDRQRMESRKRRKENPFIGVETKTCEYCGCEYIPDDGRKRRTCGVRCRRLLNNRETLEKYHQKRGVAVQDK